VHERVEELSFTVKRSSCVGIGQLGEGRAELGIDSDGQGFEVID